VVIAFIPPTVQVLPCPVQTAVQLFEFPQPKTQSVVALGVSELQGPVGAGMGAVPVVVAVCGAEQTPAPDGFFATT
jgi:hypothetical protein